MGGGDNNSGRRRRREIRIPIEDEFHKIWFIKKGWVSFCPYCN